MTNKALSIFNQLRPLSVGFDDVFDHFESMFDGPTISIGSNYPPYNIVKTGKHTYDVEVALAWKVLNYSVVESNTVVVRILVVMVRIK